MSHTTSSRRIVAAIGATAFLGIVLAAPAMAKPVPGPGASTAATTSSSTTTTTIDRERQVGGYTFSTELSTLPEQSQPSAPSTSVKDSSGIDRARQAGGFTYSKELSTLPPEATKPSQPTIVLLEDHGVEYLQVGAGVLVGIALAAAGAVVVSRRNHGGLTPA